MRAIRYDLERDDAPAAPSEADPPLACEAELVAILDEQFRDGETYAAAFLRKERALGERFAQLSAADARLVHRRLSRCATDDALAARFARLLPDRRLRLLAFLADAPRRAALGGRRR
jgi:hypothetical protein